LARARPNVEVLPLGRDSSRRNAQEALYLIARTYPKEKHFVPITECRLVVRFRHRKTIKEPSHEKFFASTFVLRNIAVSAGVLGAG
jgi:hypothetical protein